MKDILLTLGRKLWQKRMWRLRQSTHLKRCSAVQVSVCSECLSLLLPLKGSRDSTCMISEQVVDLLCVVVELKKEVERLMSIRECKKR